MGERPRSEATDQDEMPKEEGENKSLSPPPPTAAVAALSSPAPKPKPKPKASPSPPPTTAASSSPDPASRKAAAPKTLAISVPPAAPNSDSAPGGDGCHRGGECRSFSHLLAGAMASSPLGNSLAMPIVAVPVDAVGLPIVALPCFIAPAALLESPGVPGQFAMTHRAVLATVTAQAQIQFQSAYTSPTAPAVAPVPIQQRPLSACEDNALSPEADQQPSSDQKSQSALIVLKATSGDRFNWRKYGQKQVKSSENSRSYYRCTQANCSAKKKVECSQDGHVIEVLFKGGHNHDPPQKIKCSKERRPHYIALSGDNETSTHESGLANGTVLSPSKVEQDSGSDTPEQQLHCSSDCEADGGIKAEEDLDEEPNIKRRLTERPAADPIPLFKAVKEPKVVVQKASEVGLSTDGYKWRKYGQKIVKGNPNPRSYYKCTQMGCPARKHVEKDSADAKAMIIQYEGKHNHDLPTPKHGSDPPAAALLIAAAAEAATINAEGCAQSPRSVEKRPRSEQKSDVHPKTKGKKASELGGDKTLESAQTLLSIGLESTPKEGVKRTSSDVGSRSLFDKNCAVPVQNS